MTNRSCSLRLRLRYLQFQQFRFEMLYNLLCLRRQVPRYRPAEMKDYILLRLRLRHNMLLCRK